MRERIRIKICGICCSEDARYAVELGAEAIGLVFYGRSPRCVGLQEAAIICAAVPAWTTCVGLFMNHTASEVNNVLSAVPLNLLQFHGDETAEFCNQFSRPYIKAISGHDLLTADETRSLAALDDLYCNARALLLDAHTAGKAGGSGQRLDWSLLKPQLATVKPHRLALAGGLNADNIATAVQQTGIKVLDVSSGVESSPGVKDHGLLLAFMQQVAIISGYTHKD